MYCMLTFYHFSLLSPLPPSIIPICFPGPRFLCHLHMCGLMNLYMREYTQYLSFWDLIVSLSKIIFISSWNDITLSLWLKNVCICLSVAGQLGRFHELAIMNSTCMNTWTFMHSIYRKSYRTAPTQGLPLEKERQVQSHGISAEKWRIKIFSRFWLGIL